MKHDTDDENLYLYHYTDENGFRGIIKTKSLYLFSTDTMNDPEDRHFGLDCINKAIAQSREGNYLYQLRGVKFNDRLTPQYSMSFCEDDNFYLWGKYANKHKGLAVIIDKDYFNKQMGILNKRLVPNYRFRGLRFSEIKYGSSVDYIEEVAKDIYPIAGINEADHKVYQDMRKLLWFRILNSICSGFIKSGMWKKEKEYRLSYTDMSEIINESDGIHAIIQSIDYFNFEPLLNVLKLSKENRSYWTTAGKKKYYYPLSIEEMLSSALIPYIIMGSACGLSESKIRALLDSSGLGDTRIIQEGYSLP